MLHYSESGTAVCFYPEEPSLCSEILPGFFSHSNLSSFRRQLNVSKTLISLSCSLIFSRFRRSTLSNGRSSTANRRTTKMASSSTPIHSSRGRTSMIPIRKSNRLLARLVNCRAGRRGRQAVSIVSVISICFCVVVYLTCTSVTILSIRGLRENFYLLDSFPAFSTCEVSSDRQLDVRTSLDRCDPFSRSENLGKFTDLIGFAIRLSVSPS